MTDLPRRAWRATALFLIGLLLALFLPAWTLNYWQAWLYWSIYAATSVVGTAYLLKVDPGLIARRLAVGPAAETEDSQKRIMTFASACYALLLVMPGFDHHWHWSDVPVWLVLLANAGSLAGYAMVFLVVRANSYAAATVRVEPGQPVISSGPYALVRHPMYSGALLMLGATPLALGSYWGLLVGIPTAAGLVWRLIDEERFLLRNLPGYAEYCGKVRSRLIPCIW